MSNFLYTITNREKENAVVGMEILKNGKLQFIKGSPFLTGGKGSRSSQSQNGIWIDGGLLYAVDFGSSSFAVFQKNADGTLTRLNKKPIPSNGNSPCSVCVHKGILYVLNQGVRSSGSKAQPSLAVFRISGGKVQYLPKSSFKFQRGESPTQVIINNGGTVLAVPSVRNRRSLLHCYKINNNAAGKPGLLTEFGNSPMVIANTGYGFGSVWKSDNKTLFMTNAIGTGSVVKFTIDVSSNQILLNTQATTKGNACWAALAHGEKKLYITNLLSFLVFDISGNGLARLQSLDVKDIKNSVLRDLILGPGGKFVYAIEQRKRRILIYSVGKKGLVSLSGEMAVGVPGYTFGLAIG